jgi:REP element-mobilizing transposase RayT
MDQDYAEYCGLLADSCRRCATQVLAYCPMPNHVHLIMVLAEALGLKDALGASASPIHSHDQFSRALERASLARAFSTPS